MPYDQVLRTIHCADCGTPTETKRSNTKVCSVCRLIRDLPYVGGRLGTCGLCGTEFARLSLRDPQCGGCQPRPADHDRHRITCAFCKKRKPSVRRGISVCADCARNPELRAKFWSSLKRKQAQQREATGWVEPEEAHDEPSAA